MRHDPHAKENHRAIRPRTAGANSEGKEREVKYVFQMWGITVIATGLAGFFNWHPFLVFVAGMAFGAAVVMSAVEVLDNA